MKRNNNRQRVFGGLAKGSIFPFFLMLSAVSFGGIFPASGRGAPQRKIALNAANEKARNVRRKIEEARGWAMIKPVSKDSTTVSGRITDAKTGEPLPGAHVTVKGTANGTISDSDGKYALTVEEQNAALVFASIGYASQEAPIGSRSVIDIQMAIASKQLDEVVVVGYGMQKKASLTSAVSSVKTDEFKDVPYANIMAALSGRAAGVVVSSWGGEPGIVPDITIRGGEPLISRTVPLYVIDGIIRDQTTFAALNINDIAGISFLKDAAAAAVYGAKASGGIVLVTTKSGAEGKPQLEYSNNFSYNTPSYFPKLINSYDKAIVANAIGEQLGNGRNSAYTPEDLEAIRTGSNPAKFPNTDWYKECFKAVAPQQQHSLSLSGGNKQTKYYIGLGMLNQGSNYINNAIVYKRYSYDVRIDNALEGTGLTWAAGLNGYIVNSIALPAYTVDIFSHIAVASPLVSPYNPDGTLAGLSNHPLAEICSPGYDRAKSYFVDGNITLKWEVPWVKGLSARLLLDCSADISNNKIFDARAPQYNVDGSLFPVTKPSLSERSSFGSAYNNEFQADYSSTFGQHGLEASFVSIARAGKLSRNSASRKNFPSAAVDQMSAGDASTQTNGGSASDWGNLGLVGRLKYDYALKYIIEFTGRYDGSDYFPPTKRFGLFPAVSAAWAASSENFYGKTGLNKVFSELKFRASYGKTGSTGTKYAYLPTYNNADNFFVARYVTGGNINNGFSEGALTVANQNVTWYATTSYDLAVDFVALHGHLSGTFDFYDTQSKNILGSPSYRYTEPLGKALPQVLTDAATHKRGFDATWQYDYTINKNWKLYAGFNMTFFNYLWKKSNEDSVTLANPYTRAQGINQNYNDAYYYSNGLYQNYEQILNSPWHQNTLNGGGGLAPGDVWYQDANGDGQITGDDFRRQGKARSPQFVYGIPFGLAYKNITVDALLQGTGRRDVYLGGNTQASEGLSRVNFDFQKDYWTASNANSSFPRLGAAALANNNNYAESSFWLKNAQYFRLKSLSISCDFSPYLKSAKFIKSLSVHFSGINLLTWSPITKYCDPELADVNNSLYPENKTYAIGLRAGF